MTLEAPTAKPPRWWIAALLNLFGGFGAGYLYARQPKRALIAAASTVLILAVLWHGLGGWLAEPWIAVIVLGSWLLLTITFVVDGALVTRRSSAGRTWYNRWWIYLAVILASGGLAAVLDFKRSVRPFTMPAASMEPTLRVGEHFFVDMRAFELREPKRGDVVIFELPRDRATFFLKRVVGLPGDEIQVKDSILHLNGKAVPTEVVGQYSYAGSGAGEAKQQALLKREALGPARSAVVLDTTANGLFDNTPLFKVPAGHYFMLGDNRDNSTDSREQSSRFGVGYVPRTNIIGKISWIYWSGDWSRIGTKID